MDIDLAVFLLCTRLPCIIDEDWEKLRRLLHYLQSTLNLRRVIGVNRLDILQMWVNVSYAAYNIRGHTKGVMSMGQGVTYGKSSKQK